MSFIDADTYQTTWDEHLYEFQLEHNSSDHSATKFTPFYLVHGREARLLADPDFGVQTIPTGEYDQNMKKHLGRALSLVKAENVRSQADNAINYNIGRTPPSFTSANLVLISFPVQSNAAQDRAAKLVPKFRGPFKIPKTLSTDRFGVVDLNTNKTWTNIHASRMKPYRNEDIAHDM